MSVSRMSQSSPIPDFFMGSNGPGDCNPMDTFSDASHLQFSLAGSSTHPWGHDLFGMAGHYHQDLDFTAADRGSMENFGKVGMDDGDEKEEDRSSGPAAFSKRVFCVIDPQTPSLTASAVSASSGPSKASGSLSLDESSDADASAPEAVLYFYPENEILRSLNEAKPKNLPKIAFSEDDLEAVKVFATHFLKEAVEQAQKDPRYSCIPSTTIFVHNGKKYPLPRSVEIIKDPDTGQVRACLALNQGTKNKEEGRDRDKMDKLVAYGGSKRVKFAIDLFTGELIIRQTLIHDKNTLSEVLKLLKYSGRPGMIKVLGTLEFDSKYRDNEFGNRIHKLVIFLPYCKLGDLDNVLNKPKMPFVLKEKDQCFIVDQLLAGLEHLHKDDLVHSDVKPLNLLVNFSNGVLTCHLNDLGSSHKAGMITFKGGTQAYLAPEVLLASSKSGFLSTQARDMWAVGCIIYEIIHGGFPSQNLGLAIETNDKHKIEAQIERRKKLRPSLIRDDMLPKKDGKVDTTTLLFLAQKLMHFDPAKRPNVFQARLHVQHLLKA